MRLLLFYLTFLPLSSLAQFGFVQDTTNLNVEVIKNGIQQKFPWVGGLNYCQFSNIDLDLDGTLDLFIYDQSGDKVLTFLQKGGAGVMDFEYAPSYEESFNDISPKLEDWVLLVDYDGDGQMDIFSPSSGGIRVLRNTALETGGLSFELETPALPSTIYGNISGVYASTGDIPSFVDVDFDGDIDVLSFYLNGSCVRYYKNLCQETYGHSDSLFYETVSVCYGNFQEANSTNIITLNSCCSSQVPNPQMGVNERPVGNHTDRHVGSTVLALDLDADNMMDLVLGDVSYNSLTMLMNGGTTPNTNSAMISQDNAFPSYDVPVNLPVFPAAFYVDVNNDNVRDLLVSPMTSSGTQNYQSNWFYRNTGADNFPVFEHQQNDFLQAEMIDYGSGALPVFFDHNGDGLKDLLVSIRAKYNPNNGNYESKIAYYENTGTAVMPQFTFITDDYQGLSAVAGGGNLYLYPTFGDLDGDLDEDLLLGSYNGLIYYFENTGGIGNPAVFTSYSVLENQLGDTINEGVLNVPKLVDLNRDFLVDLVLRKRNGQLSYYKNVGTLAAPMFELQTTALGGVDVSTSWSIEGIAIPEFVDIEDEYHLVIGSKSGYVHYYNDIEGNLGGTFNLAEDLLDDILIGEFTAPAITDLDGDNKLEMVLGNDRGGLALFESAIITDVGLTEETIAFNIYPNPAENYFEINFSQFNYNLSGQVEYSLLDITGKEVANGKILKSQMLVDCSTIGKGIYILNINLPNKTLSQKLVLQ